MTNCRTCIGLLVVSAAYLIVSTFVGVEEEFSRLDIAAFLTAAGVALVAEAAIVYLSSFARHGAVPLLVTAAFIVLNAFFLNLVMVADFIALNMAAKLGLMAAGVFMAFTVLKMMHESKRLRYGAFLVLGALIVFPISDFVSESNTAVYVKSPTGTAAPNISIVDFVDKPNVYLIGFESMAPGPVLEKYLKLKDPTLPAAFEANGFRVFPNMFTEAYPTYRSFNILLSLDREYYRKLDAAGRHLFQGIDPSPLLQIFQHNGYETTVVHENSFFGSAKGPFVDSYEINRPFSVCSVMEPMERRFAFFGGCWMRSASLFSEGKKVPGGRIDFLLANIENAISRERPQLFVSHIDKPTHVDRKSFRATEAEITAFREKYMDLSEEAAVNLEKITSLIRERDPNAILFVFGDHGVFLSENVAFDDNRTFYVQDKYAILGGVYPRDACASTFDTAGSFMTTTKMARLLIKCLSGGVDAFDPEYRHQLLIGRDSGQIDYNGYLYQ